MREGLELADLRGAPVLAFERPPAPRHFAQESALLSERFGSKPGRCACRLEAGEIYMRGEILLSRL